MMVQLDKNDKTMFKDTNAPNIITGKQSWDKGYRYGADILFHITPPHPQKPLGISFLCQTFQNQTLIVLVTTYHIT